MLEKSQEQNSSPMLAWGRNENGQLGVGDTLPRISPIKVFTSSTFSCISCGSRTTLGVSANSNTVLGWGFSGSKVLGEEVDDDVVTVPRTIEQLEHIVSVSTRGAHALALDSSGKVFFWGRSEQDHQTITRVRSVAFPGIVISQISVGRMHSVVLDKAGKVYTWGSSDEGQTGLNVSTFVVNPTLVSSMKDPVSRIACGSRHTLLLVSQRSKNEVWAFGGNAYAQLGLGDREPRFVPTLLNVPFSNENDEDKEPWFLACGYRHSFIYTKKQVVFSFGWNSHHQCSPSSQTCIPTPTLFTLNDNFGDIVQIAGGGRHSLLLFRERTNVFSLFAFGRGVSGELGVNFCPNLVSIPTRVCTIVSSSNSAPLLSCGWEHSVLSLGEDCKLGKEATNNHSAQLISFLRNSSLRGDCDAAMAQFVNAIVLLRLVPSETKTSVGLTIAWGSALFGTWALLCSSTSLPHGLNTVAFFALEKGCLQVMLRKFPGEYVRALQSCMFCTFWLGVFQFVGATVVVPLLHRHVPKPALSASVAGIALAFITTKFLAEEFESPIAGLTSFLVLLIGFGARERMPFGIPVALVSLAVGWAVSSSSDLSTTVATMNQMDPLPLSLVDALIDVDNVPFLFSLVLPLCCVNLINNLACVDQAKGSGDFYSGRNALYLDSLAMLVGVIMFGNPFPTCIYVGHASFKAMGARHMYAFFTSALVLGLTFHSPPLLVSVVESIPAVATVGMLVWIGLIVTAEAFRQPKKYHFSIVLGIMPALASAMTTTTTTSKGLVSLGEGYMLVSLVLASVGVHLIDRHFLSATLWLVLAAFLSVVGWMHTSNAVEMSRAYLACASITGMWALWQWTQGESEVELEVVEAS